MVSESYTSQYVSEDVEPHKDGLWDPEVKEIHREIMFFLGVLKCGKDFKIKFNNFVIIKFGKSEAQKNKDYKRSL